MKKNLFFAALALIATSSLKAQIPSFVPANGLVGWWPFNGNANDESGNGNNGTVNNAIPTTDRFGNQNKAFSFGTNKFIAVNSTTALALSNSFTISAWLFRNTSSFSAAITKERLGGGFSYYLLGGDAVGINNGPPPPASAPNCNKLGQTASGSASNTWYNLTATWNGIALTLFVNGIQILVTNGILIDCGSALTNGPQPLLFGMDNTNTYPFFEGKIDDIGIWNRALSQEEISALYAACNVSVSGEPANQTATVGSNAQFTVSASETGATYQWQSNTGLGWQAIFNAGQYSGATSDTLRISNVTVANNNQAFRCIISSGSCTDTSETAVLTVVDNSGIENSADLGVISLFPNPAKDQITLKGSAAMIGKTYRIVNQEGKVVVTGILAGEQQLLSLENLPAGMYTLHIGSEEKQSFKIIKE